MQMLILPMVTHGELFYKLKMNVHDDGRGDGDGGAGDAHDGAHGGSDDGDGDSITVINAICINDSIRTIIIAITSNMLSNIIFVSNVV